jgi:alpha-galactosidase
VVTNQGSVVFGVIVDRGDDATTALSEVKVDFAMIGITGKARVRDVWTQKDLGVFTGEFARKLPLHGAGLYRITPVR